MADPKTVHNSRASSPYRDLARFEEPLISFSVTPNASPPEARSLGEFDAFTAAQSESQGHDWRRDDLPRYEHLHPQQAVSRSRGGSAKKSDYEIALEMAREYSLMDIENPAAQQ